MKDGGDSFNLNANNKEAHMKKAFVLLLIVSLTFLACSDNEEPARKMLDEALSLQQAGKDDKANIILQDIIRKYPKTQLAIELNKTALSGKEETKRSNCDKGASLKVQAMLKEMATWQEENGKIAFFWGSDWDQGSPQQRLGLIKTFADSDACLTGSAREIQYYRNGKLVGETSPIKGIKLLDN